MLRKCQVICYYIRNVYADIDYMPLYLFSIKRLKFCYGDAFIFFFICESTSYFCASGHPPKRLPAKICTRILYMYTKCYVTHVILIHFSHLYTEIM